MDRLPPRLNGEESEESEDLGMKKLISSKTETFVWVLALSADSNTHLTYLSSRIWKSNSMLVAVARQSTCASATAPVPVQNHNLLSECRRYHYLGFGNLQAGHPAILSPSEISRRLAVNALKSARKLKGIHFEFLCNFADDEVSAFKHFGGVSHLLS